MTVKYIHGRSDIVYLYGGASSEVTLLTSSIDLHRGRSIVVKSTVDIVVTIIVMILTSQLLIAGMPIIPNLWESVLNFDFKPDGIYFLEFV